MQKQCGLLCVYGVEVDWCNRSEKNILTLSFLRVLIEKDKFKLMKEIVELDP